MQRCSSVIVFTCSVVDPPALALSCRLGKLMENIKLWKRRAMWICINDYVLLEYGFTIINKSIHCLNNLLWSHFTDFYVFIINVFIYIKIYSQRSWKMSLNKCILCTLYLKCEVNVWKIYLWLLSLDSCMTNLIGNVFYTSQSEHIFAYNLCSTWEKSFPSANIYKEIAFQRYPNIFHNGKIYSAQSRAYFYRFLVDICIYSKCVLNSCKRVI